jgi:hypothetical protein
MEIKNSRNYLNLYNKYKSKYLRLKKSIKEQTGGSDDLTQTQYELIELIQAQCKAINDMIIKIKEKNPQDKTLNLKNINEPEDIIADKKQINELVEHLKILIEIYDIPINLYGYPYLDLDELEEGINKIINETTIEKLKDKYKLRDEIYLLDDTNYSEVLDMMITKFNINSPADIENIFQSTILGYNKNYIFGYMVLFRFLVKNKMQLSTVGNNISYLTFGSIFNSLDNSINDEEYISIIMELINQYIKIVPIKKVIQIRNPPEMDKIFGPVEINKKIELIDSYDSKNRVIIYKSGIIKDEKKAVFDDIKQILNTLFRIPAFNKIQ